MLTIIYLPHIGDGEGLAAVANNVYSMYQNSGVILNTGSVPRTESAEAQHLIVAALTGDDLLEVAMARLVIVDEIGVILVFSHRFYGDDSSQAMEAWFTNYGESSQDALMEFTDIPAREQLSN